MPSAGFEPATPASDRPQTFALDRSATGIGLLEGGECLAPRPGRFTPGKEIQYTLDRKLNGLPGSVWTGAENVTPSLSPPAWHSIPGPPSL